MVWAVERECSPELYCTADKEIHIWFVVKKWIKRIEDKRLCYLNRYMNKVKD